MPSYKKEGKNRKMRRRQEKKKKEAGRDEINQFILILKTNKLTFVV